MELIVSKSKGKFIVSLIKNGNTDFEYVGINLLVEMLNINMNLLRKIMRKNNGALDISKCYYNFENELDCQQAIRELEPYIIMENLVK